VKNYVKKKGFTLVELLVVIAIIAMLLSILIPSMNRAKEIAKRVVCGSGLKGIGSAMALYADAYDNQLPKDRVMKPGDTKDTLEAHPYLVYRSEPADTWRDLNGKLIPLRWACLFEKKYIAEPKIFYCTGNDTGKSYRYTSYIDPPPWGTLPQKYNSSPGGPVNEWVRIGYTYFPTDYTSRLRGSMQTSLPYREPNCTRFDRLDRDLPYATDLIWSRDGLSHKSGIREMANNQVIVLNPGINGVFKDGHVVYCGNRDVFNESQMANLWKRMENRTLDTPGEYSFHYTIFSMVSP
jgi:prepilin-type N-terminal cleavage/methylation domain-containing protein